jgi:hypothetical protein
MGENRHTNFLIASLINMKAILFWRELIEWLGYNADTDGQTRGR